MTDIGIIPFSLGRCFFLSLLLMTGLAGCGGGGGGGSNSASVDDAAWKPGVFKPASDFQHRCEKPRIGFDPVTRQTYRDRAGSTLTENNWLRSWTHETYLWYDEVTDRNPAAFDDPLDYFAVLKTEARTPSGTLKDQFHYAEDTAVWQALSGSGVSAGYGVTWAVIRAAPPREIRVAYTEPGSPATAPGVALSRGARVLEVNGVDAVYGNSQAAVDVLNSVLYPGDTGQIAELVVEDVGATVSRRVYLTSTLITSTPVQHVKVFSGTGGERVGYLLFNDHIATAEAQLVGAVDEFAADGVTQLVLDLRYNGGGLLAIASQLAYMIADSRQTAGQPFYQLRFNDKHPTRNPVTGEPLAPTPFYNQTLGFSTTAGRSLPRLNLERVFILTGPNTCSASEAVINGLRGVDIEVIQIGAGTCGKPYGFYPTDNCGTTYFTVQFAGVNAKGFGDYSDGFRPGNNPADPTTIPGCRVADDYLHELGNRNEARLAAALTYIETGSCPAGTSVGMQKQARPIEDGYVVKPASLNNAYLLVPDQEVAP